MTTPNPIPPASLDQVPPAAQQPAPPVTEQTTPPASPATPAAPPAASVHTVAAGDTLDTIATEHGIPAGVIAAANRDAYPSLQWHPVVQIGWQLTLPTPPAQPPAPEQ